MSGTTNKIPNSDIIGFEGPVGHERSVHKWQFTVPEKTWKSGNAEWVQTSTGKWKYIPRETRDREARYNAAKKRTQ